MSGPAALVFLADYLGGHMGDGWWVGMLLFWGVIGTALIWAVRTHAGERREDGGSATAMELLDRRLAEGGISIDEYEQRRRLLLDHREAGNG